MIGIVRYVPQLWRCLGPGWLAYRLSYAARMRTGLLRRQMPATDWSAHPLSAALNDPALADPTDYLAYRRNQAPAFFFTPSDRERYQSYLVEWDRAGVTPIGIASDLAQGILHYFEHTVAQVGFPPDWFANPFTGQRAPAVQHWSQIADFGHGDIKVIWEPSRFGFTYALVRAYWRTGDERYAELFWRLVEDWHLHNPPQRGPNWKCGQEISFRVMAWCFGLYGFLDAAAASARRVADLAQMIAVSGQRIEANLSYALSQRNNHGISEGVGLWTIGSLFPELRDAARWRAEGRDVLERLGRELIYADGSFTQHSVNYHRLMLHDYIWALRLGDLLCQPFRIELKARVSRAAMWLYQLQDEVSGRVPNYGSNDGALILPLNNCDYQDFRPAVQAAHYVCTRARVYTSGPWDEDLLWLFGPTAVQAPVRTPPRADLQAEPGGYYTLRAQSGFTFVRCATLQHRPAQADMLHVDLWWRGQNLAIDAGTYSYNAPDPWNDSLAHTAYHNTVTVDDLDQMNRVGKFLWLPWLCSRIFQYNQSYREHRTYWEGEHDGYERLKAPVTHRRGVLRLGDDYWLVLDALLSEERHSYRLHWLFADLPYEWDGAAGDLRLHTAAGPYYIRMATASGIGAYSLVRADQDSARGWWAPYYYDRQPALSVDLVAEAPALCFWTLLGPAPVRVTAEGVTLHLETEQWQGSVTMRADRRRSLVASISIAGALEDQLEV